VKKMPNIDQLGFPDAVRSDPKAFEILRVWIAKKGQHVSLRTDVWEDPAAWGLMLADLASHIANSYQQSSGLAPLKTLQRIKAALDVELGAKTGELTGEIRD